MNRDDKKELIVEAIKVFRQDEIKFQKKKIYHNTELLLKNYNELKQHTENAVYKAGQIFMLNEEELMQEELLKDIGDEEDELYINAIRKSKVRTAIMVQHVDMALDVLQSNAQRDGYINKYEILIGLYLSKKTYEQLAEEYNCDTTTIRRWKNDVLTKFSILLFGQEALIMAV